MQIAPEYYHCIILRTQKITIFSVKNVKVIDAQKVKFYQKIGKFAKKCVRSSGENSTEAFPILLLWKIDICMVMMHVSIDLGLMQS